jgi:hypothetical protein
MRWLLLIGVLLIAQNTLAQDNNTPNKKDSARVLIINFTPDYNPPAQPADTIYFNPKRPLQWKDFTGKTSYNSQDEAVSYTSFAYTGSASQQHDTLFVTLTLQVFFVKSASWASPSAYLSDYALQHEQTHFDLTRLAAENFKQMVLEGIHTIAPEDANSYIQYLYIDAFRNMNHLQDQFDDETNHGEDHAEEAKWVEYATRQINKIFHLP